jgi:hypothetical protein
VKSRHVNAAIAEWCVVLFVFASMMQAQQATLAGHTGVPQDWSDSHIVFSRDTLALHPELLDREPRVFHRAMQRWQAPNSDVFHGDVAKPVSLENSSHPDWSIANSGGRLDANMFPVKFSFDPSAPPSCANDFVVFGLAVVGTTGGQANLVAYNNLYSGTSPTGMCGTAPTVLFAYNITTASTTGKIVTSLILSEDGTKIGFVESLTGSAIFHVLTWTAGHGTLKAAAAPSSMTSLTFSATAGSTSSSPWIDYGNDIVYLGDDSGVIHKITGVFKGTPTLAGAPWPVTVSSGYHLTPPVLDATLGALMVGSANGNLYKISTSTGVLSTGLPIGAGTSGGIYAAPIVDVTNGTTFVVVANDGKEGGALVQLDTSDLTEISKSSLGQAAFSGTAMRLYEPAFSNGYFTKPSSGVVRLCGTGTADTTPWQYAFGFNAANNMKTTASFSQQLINSTAARCTGWTEFFNPNISGGTDYFFFGLTQDCTGTGVTFGCVAETTGNSAPVTATINGGPSGIVVDNYSTAAQASSIYFSAERINALYKLTQNGLQ